jgi:hypothetical protein
MKTTTIREFRKDVSDSNVLLSAAVGHAARRVFERAPRFLVVTTEANLDEVEQKEAAKAGFDPAGC